jgi:hypothetical protein
LEVEFPGGHTPRPAASPVHEGLIPNLFAIAQTIRNRTEYLDSTLKAAKAASKHCAFSQIEAALLFMAGQIRVDYMDSIFNDERHRKLQRGPVGQ